MSNILRIYILVCCFCTVLCYSKQAVVIYNDEGFVKNVNVEYIQYRHTNEFLVLSDLASQTSHLTNIVNFTLYERDCRPVTNPDTKIWNNSSLLEIAKSGEFSGVIDKYKEYPIDFSPIDMSLHSLNHMTGLIWSKTISISSNTVKVSYNLKDEFWPYEIIKNVQTASNVISYVIGAPEFVYSEDFERKAYRVPESFKIQFSKLSSQLRKTGTSIAYDPKTNILVVVDRVNSVTFLFLKTIGFKVIVL
ncbi:MAG: hypothetical protein PF692_08570 [Kiritimatiellae bacterium]|jgi:hypothetical protein|nr:hypothetical protein [Kiritimatiellia bacterium]